MRITLEEISAIKAAANDMFGPDTVVRLFGSRVHDHLKGGDIDLHFELNGGRPDVATAARFRDAVIRQIGDRAIDMVFHDPLAPLRPIDRVAIEQGVAL